MMAKIESADSIDDERLTPAEDHISKSKKQPKDTVKSWKFFMQLTTQLNSKKIYYWRMFDI